MTRRQRLLRLTAALGLLFLVVAAAVVWRVFRPDSQYRPGETVEGLTADLARSLPKDYPRVSFTDVTRASGISFQHFSGTRSSQLPEDMGSGAAWGDFDNDGWVDLVVANEVGPLSLSDAARAQSPARTVLYHNNHDSTFTDVTTRSGIDFRGWGMAVAWGDFDNDGWIDLVITAYGHCVLYRNNGDGTFTDRSAASGIGGPRGFWTGAAWGDYDRDGLLDLYVTGYVKYTRPERSKSAARYDVENPASINPLSFPPDRGLLFHNNGHGTFTEVASSLGVTNPTGRGLGAAWVDLDEDGWPDLYVANDVSDNVLYRNLGKGKFSDISDQAHVADYRSAMGIAVGDWDGDGDQDLFLTHWLAQENALYDNQLAQLTAQARKRRPVPLTFVDEADRYGLGQVSLDYVGWGTSFIDYDNDGRPDLFVVNGSTLQFPEDSTRCVPMRSQLFWNRGPADGFFDVSAVSGSYFRNAYVGRGAAFADYDNDGDIDVFVVNNGGPGILLRNDGGNRNHWLAVELRGTKSNRQGIGAKLRLVAGGVSQVRQVGAQSSYLSQNSLIENFGVRALTRVDSLVVVWPSGVRQVRTNLPANQRLVVVEGEEMETARERIQDFWALYREATLERTARQTQAAAETYSRALALNPDHEDVLYYFGSMRFALGDFAAAEGAWRRLIARNPSSARTHSQLGSLYLCLDANAPFQLDSAETHLRLAYEINKEETGPLLHLGEAALVRGDLVTAGRYFNEVLGSHAKSAEARFYVGYIALKGADTVRAQTEFSRATSATAPPPAAGVPGEGDTKHGAAPLTQRTERCDQLRALATAPRAASPVVEMFHRYRRLDSFLSVARSRFR
ncbi:MAG TPA: FG-GAP-like repeat-containing protein [Gemmatimonadaceae bacterium]|nr:FG-GAP-like repeat-containing protein [Gemmatimonadaceae bacterium]